MTIDEANTLIKNTVESSLTKLCQENPILTKIVGSVEIFIKPPSSTSTSVNLSDKDINTDISQVKFNPEVDI